MFDKRLLKSEAIPSEFQRVILEIFTHEIPSV